MKFRERVKAKKVFFSLKEKLEEGAFSNGRTISLRLGGKGEKIFINPDPLKGIHNVEKYDGCSHRGQDPSVVQKKRSRTSSIGLKGLSIVSNLFETSEGFRFYNDSKGTNVGSVVKSLQSFSEPVILIAGGKDKNGDLSPLGECIQRRVKYLVLIGEAKERMKHELGGLTDTVMAQGSGRRPCTSPIKKPRQERSFSSRQPVRASICSKIIKRGEKYLKKRSNDFNRRWHRFVWFL